MNTIRKRQRLDSLDRMARDQGATENERAVAKEKATKLRKELAAEEPQSREANDPMSLFDKLRRKAREEAARNAAREAAEAARSKDKAEAKAEAKAERTPEPKPGEDFHDFLTRVQAYWKSRGFADTSNNDPFDHWIRNNPDSIRRIRQIVINEIQGQLAGVVDHAVQRLLRRYFDATQAKTQSDWHYTDVRYDHFNPFQ